MRIVKVVIITVILILTGLIGTVVLILVLDTSNDYKEAYIPKARYKYLFDDQWLDSLKVGYSYKNESGSSIINLTYQENIRILIWEIAPLHQVNISETEVKNKAVDKDNLTSYFKLYTKDPPFLEFSSKMDIPESEQLFLKTGNSYLRSEKEGVDHIFLSLDFKEFSLGRNLESNEVIVKSEQWVKNANLLLLKRDGKFSLCLMYPLKPNVQYPDNFLLDILKQ